jgi:CRISPR system Cascade subunit CasA
VLTANQYAFAGSGGKFMQAPLVAGYCITLEGENLFQTLMLNVQGYNNERPESLDAEGDAPWWELETDPPLDKSGLRPRGLTDLLTWRSRKLRLLPEADGMVRWVSYAQRYVVADPEYRLRDPFKRYEMRKSGPSIGISFPRNFSADRALWRDVDALIEKADSIASDEDTNGRPAIIDWLADVSDVLEDAGVSAPMIVATGLVNTQAKIDLWRMERLPLPVSLLDDDDLIGIVRDAVTRAEIVRECLRDAGSQFASTALTTGTRSPDSTDITREREALNLEVRYWSRLEARFQQFMTELADTDDPQTPLDDWTLDLATLAREVFRDATRAAGGDSRWLMAQAAGGRTLDNRLFKRVPEIQEIQDARREAMPAGISQ